ncbi:unnamed protein product [Bursaphelenchus xylophilus]|uniref:(pine wood nematode) hypothetical protein n=1 Tax=Bursaphelenchus xylophilus TaxID=6326 RepID=A0A1I7RVW3_BURXY|nr:unnamed protein product [Bursaphelenchus xylophilus]CAG9094783.1 unnamed protein product [Bursaphelenchus xylophilus]
MRCVNYYFVLGMILLEVVVSLPRLHQHRPKLKLSKPTVSTTSGPVKSSTVPTDDTRRTTFDGKVLDVPITDHHALELREKWVATALSSLMSAVADRKLKKHPSKLVKKEFARCSDKADSVHKHAKCVKSLMDNKILPKLRDIVHHPNRPSRFERYRYSINERWKNGFKIARRKRAIRSHKRAYYALHSNIEKPTPMGAIARVIMEDVLKKKNKTNVDDWKKTVEKLKNVGELRSKKRKETEDVSEETLQQLSLNGLKKHVMKGQESDVDLLDVFKDEQKLRDYLKKRKEKPKDTSEKIFGLIREGLKLAYMMSPNGTKNSTDDFDDKSMKLMSPRFFGLVPEAKEKNELEFLSPSLFALHNQGEGLENLTSLPTLLKNVIGKDQDLWLNLIMEVSGVNDQAETVRKIVEEVEEPKDFMQQYKREIVNENGVPLYWTEGNITEKYGKEEQRKIETGRRLAASYSKDQLREFNTTGYSFLTHAQLDLLYGPHSPYNDSEAHRRLTSLNHSKLHDYLEANIRHAAEDANLFNLRQNDFVVGSPFVLTSIIGRPDIASNSLILSPLVLTPAILSPAVLGGVVLSPWLFVPVVLSPRILGCLVLSPYAFSPIILTPFALHPVILSPGIFDPLILSPILLNPYVLSPLVFTPIILSPLCMAPLILSPTVGGPLILSPFVLNPLILSPMALGGVIMSPYALSPLVFSPLFAFVALLSPSWLS